MKKSDWNKIDRLLDEILLHDHPEKQLEILKEKCQDPAIYAEVEQLLESIHQSSSFWPDLFQANEKFADKLAVDDNEQQQFSDKIQHIHSGDIEFGAIPSQIGAYKIKKRIARGGMGEVFLGERIDQNFHQNVALKVIKKSETPSREFLRFEQERHILSTLSHPHIAKLLDGGISNDGRAFYVMEYIDGVPLTEYCSQNKCTLQKRLGLFKQLCQAVQYAHSNFIVHRDLKPDNLLVDKNGDIKILDFGIAKMLNATPGPGELRITSEGRQLLTYQYAAPEQLSLNTVTTATDIYTLGLLLYELLNEVPAYNFNGKKYSDIQHTILHEQAPAPSKGPAKKTSLADPELDAIVLKALRKEPEGRYQSAQHMYDDVVRYQKKLPVLAKQGSRYYVFKKFIRRHSISFSAAVIILLLITGFFLFYTSQINEERNLARLQAQRAEQATSILIDLFEANQPGNLSGEDISITNLLELGIQKADNLHSYPELKATMYSVIGQIYRKTGNLGQAEYLLNNAFLINKNMYGETHPETLAGLDHFGLLLIDKGEFRQAEKLLSQSLETRQKTPAASQAELAQTINTLAYAKRRLGSLEDAEALFQQSYNIRERVLGSEHPLTLESLSSLAVVRHNKSSYEQAEAIYRDLIEKRSRVLGTTHPDYIANVSSLGSLLMNTGNFEEAELYLKEALHLRRQILGDDHPSVAITINNLGILYKEQGQLSSAKTYFEEALKIRKKILGDNHVSTAISKFSYADLYLKSSSPDTALTLLQEAFQVFKENLPENHSFIPRTQLRMGSALLASGRFPEAQEIIIPSYNAILSIHHDRSLERALADIRYGTFLAAQGNRRLARETWQHAREILLELEGPGGIRQAEILALINGE